MMDEVLVLKMIDIRWMGEATGDLVAKKYFVIDEHEVSFSC